MSYVGKSLDTFQLLFSRSSAIKVADKKWAQEFSRFFFVSVFQHIFHVNKNSKDEGSKVLNGIWQQRQQRWMQLKRFCTRRILSCRWTTKITITANYMYALYDTWQKRTYAIPFGAMLE